MLAKEVELDTELINIGNLPQNSLIFMYFQLQDPTDPTQYESGSCQVPWLASDDDRKVDLKKDSFTVKSYSFSADFSQGSEGVLGKKIDELNTDFVETDDPEWGADVYSDRTSKYEPFE